MPDETPPAAAASAPRANDDTKAGQPFKTAADHLDIKPTTGTRDPRLSQSPGLVAIEGSEVPGLGNGGMVQHVRGPQQSPVDPIAAGLDTGYIPKTAHQLRAPTQTGTIGAGNPPSTYAEKTDGKMVPQAAPADHETVHPTPTEPTPSVPPKPQPATTAPGAPREPGLTENAAAAPKPPNPPASPKPSPTPPMGPAKAETPSPAAKA